MSGVRGVDQRAAGRGDAVEAHQSLEDLADHRRSVGEAAVFPARQAEAGLGRQERIGERAGRVQGSTHYRTLFPAALVLFVMTFAVNTVAEVVR